MLVRVLAGAGSMVTQEDVLAQVPMDGSFTRWDLTAGLREARRRFERDYIAAVLRSAPVADSDAARALGLEETSTAKRVSSGSPASPGQKSHEVVAMHAPRSSTLLLCGIVMLLVSPPSLARAQSPDPERPSIRLRPVRVQAPPGVHDIGVDYNVFNQKTNPRRYFTFTAIPDLEARCTRGGCTSRKTRAPSSSTSARTRANEASIETLAPGPTWT